MSTKQLLTDFSNEIKLYYPITSVEDLIDMVKGHRDTIKQLKANEATNMDRFKQGWKTQVEYAVREGVLLELRTMTIGELADIVYKES